VKTKLSILSFFIILNSIISIQYINAQVTKPNLNTSFGAGKLELIQFHSEHRCMTCNKIEELARETLKKYPNIVFKLINIDDEKNEKMAEQFEATGTALFLYDPKTGKKKELTDFAFMNAMDKNKYIKGLENEIKMFK
jgi:thiol-disulfide isomerase/thioredoxin